jgi:hypothetical protein
MLMSLEVEADPHLGCYGNRVQLPPKNGRAVDCKVVVAFQVRTGDGGLMIDCIVLHKGRWLGFLNTDAVAPVAPLSSSNQLKTVMTS